LKEQIERVERIASAPEHKIESRLKLEPELAVAGESAKTPELIPQAEILSNVGEFSMAKKWNVPDSIGALHS